MAPVTSDLIDLARETINKTSTMQITLQEMQQQQPQEQTPRKNEKTAKDNNKKCSSRKEKEIIAPAASSPIKQKSNKIPLKFVNSHITCNICKGYLIDATTLVECLHSFCHSCIMKHLRVQDYCPKCEVLVNKAKPNIKPDATLQAIVYKLVPGLYEKELLRRRKFYRMCPQEAALATPEQRGEDTENLIFSPSENMSLSLEFADMDELSTKSELRKSRYLQCPAIFTVSNLKKFVLLKFGIDSNLLNVEIMYKVKTIVLPDHYTLMDIAYIYTWKREAPMKFYFRVVKNPAPIKKTDLNNEIISKQSDKSAEITIKEVKNKVEDKIFNDIKQNIKEENLSENIKEEKLINNVRDEKLQTSYELVKLEKSEGHASDIISKSEEKLKSSNETNNNNFEKGNKMIKNESKTQNNVDNSVKKHDPIKLKIGLTKQGNMVSIIKTSNNDTDSTHNSNSNNTNKNQNNSKESEKKKEKDKLIKQSISLLTLKPKQIKNKDNIINKKEIVSSAKLKECAKNLVKLHEGNKKLDAICDRIMKSNSNEKPDLLNASATSVYDIDPKKSEFLNTFQLKPRKILPPPKPLRPIAPKASMPNLKPISSALPTLVSKRKSKEPVKANNNLKKLKMDNTEQIKQSMEKIIREKNNVQTQNVIDKKETISFNLAPFPIGSSKQDNVSTTNNTTVANSISAVPATITTNSSIKTNTVSKVNDCKLSLTLSAPKHKITEQTNTEKQGNSKPLVPKRAASPSSTKTTNEPVFKKPLSMAKKPIQTNSPEKVKMPDTHIQKINNLDGSKKIFGPTGLHNIPFTPPHRPSNMSNNYLNYALMNSVNKGQTGFHRIPPLYSPFSPVYSPNSPQYSPNFNISSKPQNKYTNPQAYTNLMDNLLNKKSDLFPTQSSTNDDVNKNENLTVIPDTQRKSPSDIRTTPPVSPSNTKQSSPVQDSTKKPNSLLDKLNFPSSLSVTLTTDAEDSRTKSPNNKNHSNVNNYIEIVKLPETSPNNTTTDILSPISPPKSIIKIDNSKKPGENVHKDIISKVNEMCGTTSGKNSKEILPTKDTKVPNNKSPNKDIPKLSSGKETFQTKFLESIQAKLAENGNSIDLIPAKQTVKQTNGDKSPAGNKEGSPKSTALRTYPPSRPDAQKSSPSQTKSATPKTNELRKISPKPPPNQPKCDSIKNLQPNLPTTVYENSRSQLPNQTQNPYTCDPSKLAMIFNELARTSQNPIQGFFPPIMMPPMSPFNTVNNPVMNNFMQQAILLENWSKLQKSCEGNLLKQNGNQTSTNRFE